MASPRFVLSCLLAALVALPAVTAAHDSPSRRERRGRRGLPAPAGRPAAAPSPAPTPVPDADHDVVLTVNGEPVTRALYRQVLRDSGPTWRWYDALGEDMARRLLGKRTREETALIEEYAAPEFMRQIFADQDADRKRRAEEMERRAAAGENWQALIEEYTLEPRADETKGSTGARTFFDLPQPLARMAFSAEVGQVLPPALTIFGYHVARVDAIYPARAGQPERRVLSQAVLMWDAGLDHRGAPQDLRLVAADLIPKRLDIEVQDLSLCGELPNICAENRKNDKLKAERLAREAAAAAGGSAEPAHDDAPEAAPLPPGTDARPR